MNEPTDALLASHVHISQVALRSIRLERDLCVPGIAPGYVITSQTLASLERILSGLNGAHGARAWTMTGPYGSGKSYFGLFLMNLLGTTEPDHLATLHALAQADSSLAHEVQRILENGRGFFVIPVTGYRAPLQECLRAGFEHAAQRLRADEEVIEDRTATPVTSSRSLVYALSDLSRQAADYGYRGILLVIDELGKPLEFAAAHPEEADVYQLQEIAEFADRSADTPVMLLGILHQAFERYAIALDRLAQQEWAKVQGRFEDIPFQASPDQQLHLLALTLTHDEGTLETIGPLLRDHSQHALRARWCPPTMSADEFCDLATHAYPLHPTAFVALPLLFRRLAQNERSIFAYLISHEPKGFQEFLRQHQMPAFICLEHLFDYIAANFQGRLYATGRGRILAETLDRLNSTTSLTALESALLKSVGLLNWLGETSHLQATEEALVSALRGGGYGEADVRQALDTLQRRSLIVYRRFNRTFVVWQGSDVDIEDRLQQARRHLSQVFSLSEALHKYLPPRPLVARRHSYRSGTTRIFEVRYADAHTDRRALLAEPHEACGLVILCLPLTSTDAHLLKEWAQDAAIQARPDVVIGVARLSPRLTGLLYELHALQWVYEHTPELRDDSVARREWRTRVDTIETLVQQHLDEAFNSHQLADPAACRWYHRGAEVTSRMGRNLTAFLSVVCDDLFDASPRVWNELLNRRTLSSQAAAARRNLIEAMLTHPHEAMLGIEGYPPERSMYESLLRAGGLHREQAPGTWAFFSPPPEDPLRLRPLWQAIEEFVFAPPVEIRPLESLYQRLKVPPYGVTDGLLPVLLGAFYLVNQDEMTLYREESFLPEPTVADWEVLLRRPDLFAVAGCRLVGPRHAILERLARSLAVDSAVMPVVRELLRRLKTLPEHAWRTQRLPEHALRVRQVVEKTRSPEQFLFRDLPEALGLLPFDDEQANPQQVTGFFDRLNDALRALNEVTPRLRAWARDELLTACGLPTGEAGWEQFLLLAAEMDEYTTHSSLSPMLQRASNAPDPQTALDSVLAFVASRPLRTWTDADSERFPTHARAMGNLFKTENNNYESDILLTPDELARSHRLVEDLQSILNKYYNEDQRVVLAALRILLRRKKE